MFYMYLGDTFIVIASILQCIQWDCISQLLFNIERKDILVNSFRIRWMEFHSPGKYLPIE